MGVTGGIVRSIFFRNKSLGANDHNGRSNMGEKKRWSSVRSYLCGDEFNSAHAVDASKRFDSASTMSTPLGSVLALQNSSSSLLDPSDSVLAFEDSASVRNFDSFPADGEDSGSVRSSEATVTQPTQEKASFTGNADTVKKDIAVKYDNQREATETHIPKKHQTPISKLFREEDAAIMIQTAFRSYLTTRQSRDAVQTFCKEERSVVVDSPHKESMGTSLEVQTSHSVNAFSFMIDKASANETKRQKTRTQVMKIKEDWDDSTVSSTISKMRMKNRIEAMTRRERALAYAFSQQLRVCSKKKQKEHSELETNIGWSWLERWMATRVPDSSSVEQGTDNHAKMAITQQTSIINKRAINGSGELESCASNDVSLQLESISETHNEDSGQGNNRLRAAKNMSKRKSATSYQIHRDSVKRQATKRDLQRETQKANKGKSTPSGCKKEVNAKKIQLNGNIE